MCRAFRTYLDPEMVIGGCIDLWSQVTLRTEVFFQSPVSTQKIDRISNNNARGSPSFTDGPIVRHCDGLVDVESEMEHY
jgi:hypothetical protein